jgi:hypothetical protein
MGNKKDMSDKKRLVRITDHMVAPPRMEGKVKNAMSGSKRGQKKSKEK